MASLSEDDIRRLLISNAEIKSELKSVNEKLEELPRMRNSVEEICVRTKENRLKIENVEERMKENRKLGWGSFTAIATAFITGVLALISQMFKN